MTFALKNKPLLLLVAALSLLWLSISGAKTQEEATKPLPASDITKLVLLGTGNPNPFPDRSGPATAIIVNGTPYLFDAGTGVVRRAALAAQIHDLPALEAKNLKHVFLTHLHTDHTLGLADAIFTPWVLEREAPLQLFGPLGSVKMAENIIDAYSMDIERRIKGLQPQNPTGWKVDTTEIADSHIYKDDNVTIEAFPVCHGLWENALGYKVTTPDRVIVISGDTSYCPIIAEKAKGADILVHEAYAEESWLKLPDDWKRYHKAYHTSTSDLAKIASEAKPKLVVLYHQLTWAGDGIELVTEELRQKYAGRVHTGRDLEVF